MAKQKKIGNPLLGILLIILLCFSTMVAFIPILFIGLLKLIPYAPWQSLCAQLVDKVVVYWSDVNNYFVDKTQDTVWHIESAADLKRDDWYLIIANHQTWLDIVVLQKLFNRKIPMLKFFIKDQLKWIPLLGFSWWAMGCPFMKRYSKSQIEKKPHKKGRDLVRTKKAMRLFQYYPTTIINFVEGTRFSDEKKDKQQSPYQILLKPKAGGISYAISAMNEKVSSILDVTIHYSHKPCTLWDFLCRRVKQITVNIRQIPIPPEFLSDHLSHDPELQHAFRNWLNDQWHEKDQLLLTMANQ